MSAQRPQYGPHHQATRKYWKPYVDAGQTNCAELICLEERDGRTRWIPPGTRWQLAHDRTDPSGRTYRGPAHARCNESEGATYGNNLRRNDNPEQTATYWWQP